jgi:hypothetical protein
MNEINQTNRLFLPFKSVAVALLFCAFLGPVGVLYSSLIGGIVMILLGLIVLRAKLLGPIILVWLISCIVGVAFANRVNKKILQSQK